MCNKWMIVLLLMLTMALLPAAAENAWQNEAWELRLAEDTLIFTLRSKATGHEIASAVQEPDKSLNAQWSDFLCSTVAIEYAPEEATATTRAGLTRGEATWTITAAENGFDARIAFAVCQAELTLQVRLTADGLTMTVPADAIVENGPDKLCAVYIAPAMGATLRDEHEGYLFIPEAAGALIHYTAGDATATVPYSKPVYGENLGVDEPLADRENYPAARATEQVLMPVYGFAYTDDALAALLILESGEDNAEVFAYPAGVVTQYNFGGSMFILRDRYFRLNSATRGAMVYEDDIQARDLTLRLCLLEGEDATYSGMALRYRDYLTATQELSPVQRTGALRVDVLAAETEKGVLFDQTVTVTTVADMQRMLTALQAAGVERIDAYYLGWQQGGRTQGYGQKATKLDGSLGKADELQAVADALDGTLSLSADLLLAYQGRSYARDTLARQVNRESMFTYTQKTAYPQMSILSPLALADYEAALTRLATGAVDLHISGVSNTLFSHAVSSRERYTRLHTLQTYAALLARLDETYRLALTQPYACYLASTDAYLDMPVEITNYSIIDAAVPFLPLALDGLVECWSEPLNFTADPDYTLLKLVEYGVNPTFLLTEADTHILRDTNANDVYAAQWEKLTDRILQVYEDLAPVRALQAASTLCGHAVLAEDVVCLTYANGQQILINYGNEPWQAADGTLVEAVSYCITGGVE